MPVQIGDRIGDYQVIGTAGAGGMGEVYKIEHVITKRIEAMKLLPAGIGADSEQAQRFEREIQVQARLQHPNIVALYNAIRDGQSTALVMEYVEGESLRAVLDAGSGPMPIETAAAYANQVLSALSFAHRAGVIHRDVAPANIIITRDRVAKLTDFGLARGPADLRLSTSGAPIGSFWYMSPEQVKGVEPIDARTDIYAMGAVLHEMLTGAKLFDADGAFAVMQAHVGTVPAPPSARNPKTPAALDAIVCRALAKDPAARFQSAEDFRIALTRAVAAPAATYVRPPLSLNTALMGLAPVAVVAAFGVVAFVARPPRVPSTPPSAPISSVATEAPVPAGAIQPGESKPASQSQAAATQPKPHAARPSRASAALPAVMISGGEVGTPSSTDAAAPAPAHAEVLPDAPVPKAEPAPPPEPQPVQDAAVKPQKPGNRFVRALGRVNPFRKKN
jgi:eukaryotic-like serine/threonine-protein kinase